MLDQSRRILAGTCADSSVHIEHAGEGGGGRAVKVEAKRLDRQFGRGYGYGRSW